jgi:hydrogenase/urease accessory protein HupE
VSVPIHSPRSLAPPAACARPAAHFGLRSTRRLVAGLVLLLVATWPALGDEFKPAYLQVTQLDATTYDVLWKVPALDESTTLRVRPVFPAGTVDLTPRSSLYANGAAVQRWRMHVPHGLVGHSIEFPELATARIDVLVRVVRMDGTAQLGRLTPVERGILVTASPGAFEVARTYTVLGVEHILLGFDHLLFVLALLLLVDGTRRLVWSITAFTLAHSITLAAATLGVLHVPGPPVEATIALSIVFVAGEIVRARQGQRGLTQRNPWVVAFAFGLLHGLGFAGALAEVGLPEGQIPTALLFFNVGVEIGQLLFIAAVLAVLAVGSRIARHVRLPTVPGLWRVPPYVVGGLASYWVFERVAGF